MKEIYVKWLINYLNDMIYLIEFDKKIKENELCFVPIKSDEIDLYQKYSKAYLDYFYIRNDINIDILNQDEKKYLEENNNKEYDDEIKKYIELTLDRVLFSRNMSGSRKLVLYGPPLQNYMAYNDSIVIGFRFDEYNNEKKLADKEWMDNYIQKMKYIDELFSKIKEIGRTKLNKDIFIIKYNEYTIN